MLSARPNVLEILMRLSPLVLALGLAASSLAVPVVGQKPDDQIAPKSVELLQKGEAALAAGRLLEADDALETALAVDPRNRAAFVAMARVAMKQKLYGQAIRLTNKALTLEPTDKDALAVQGAAMVEQGASARAKEVLAKLQKLCTSGCPQAAELNAVITRGPSLAQAKPPVTTPKKN
jgi:cytochrome c-type biogenesis protein CcmH/NrfG